MKNVIIILFITSSCVSSNMMHTAKTLDKNNYELSLSLGVNTLPRTSASETLEQKITLQSLKIASRYGIQENLDLGLSLIVFGQYSLDMKYRIHNKLDYQLSVGVLLEYIDFYNSWSEKVRYTNLSVPIYIDITKFSSRYIPYFILRPTLTKYFTETKKVNFEPILSTGLTIKHKYFVELGGIIKKQFYFALGVSL